MTANIAIFTFGFAESLTILKLEWKYIKRLLIRSHSNGPQKRGIAK